MLWNISDVSTTAYIVSVTTSIRCNQSQLFVSWYQCNKWTRPALNAENSVECRETLGHLRPITPNLINHFTSQSPLLFLVMYVICRWSNKAFVFVSSGVICQSPMSFGRLFVDIHFSVGNSSTGAYWYRKSTWNTETYPIHNIYFLASQTCNYLIWELSILQFSVYNEWAIIGISLIQCFNQAFLNSYWVKNAMKTVMLLSF